MKIIKRDILKNKFSILRFRQEGINQRWQIFKYKWKYCNEMLVFLYKWKYYWIPKFIYKWKYRILTFLYKCKLIKCPYYKRGAMNIFEAAEVMNYYKQPPRKKGEIATIYEPMIPIIGEIEVLGF